MDFRLKVFVSVAANLSFSKAAKELGLSQPAVTKHIQTLESIYRVQLFDRGIGFVKLTTRGEFFLKRANYILNGYRMLAFEMDTITGYTTRVVRVGASETVAEYILPKMMSLYLDNNAGTKFILTFGSSRDILNDLNHGDIDIAFVEHIDGSEISKASVFMQDRVVVVAKKGVVLSETITLEQFKRIPIVLQEESSDFSLFITEQFESQGVLTTDLNILMRSKGAESIKSFLSNSSMSIALLPYSTVINEVRRGELDIIKVEGMEWRIPFAMLSSGSDTYQIAAELLKALDC